MVEPVERLDSLVGQAIPVYSGSRIRTALVQPIDYQLETVLGRRQASVALLHWSGPEAVMIKSITHLWPHKNEKAYVSKDEARAMFMRGAHPRLYGHYSQVLMESGVARPEPSASYPRRS